MGESESTRILMGVNESTIKGYPNPSISSKGAFEWTVRKIIRSNTSAFKLLFLHVQVPDEDGAFLLPFLLFYLKIYISIVSLPINFEPGSHHCTIASYTFLFLIKN